MFKLSEIKELIKLIDQSSIQELEIENEGMKVAIRKPNKAETVFIQAPSQQYYTPNAPLSIQNSSEPVISQAPAVETPAAPAAVSATLHTIVSPMVGTFYRSPSPTAPAFVSEGDKVKEKSVVCIIEAMKLMNPIDADITGEIVEVLVENGQLVEYGQALFTVKPE